MDTIGTMPTPPTVAEDGTEAPVIDCVYPVAEAAKVALDT
jgi:hypothetical protein